LARPNKILAAYNNTLGKAALIFDSCGKPKGREQHVAEEGHCSS
jgi:hypothetical protein